MAGRLRGWVALCAVCTMHVERRSAGFLVEPQNQWRLFSWFGLKTKGDGFPVWALKPITHSFKVKTECIPLCVPGSIFTHKVTNSEINITTSVYYNVS
jgi:hypothetical protein